MTGDRWLLPNGSPATEFDRRTIGRVVVLMLHEDCADGFEPTEWMLPITDLMQIDATTDKHTAIYD